MRNHILLFVVLALVGLSVYSQAQDMPMRIHPTKERGFTGTIVLGRNFNSRIAPLFNNFQLSFGHQFNAWNALEGGFGIDTYSDKDGFLSGFAQYRLFFSPSSATFFAKALVGYGTGLSSIKGYTKQGLLASPAIGYRVRSTGGNMQVFCELGFKYQRGHILWKREIIENGVPGIKIYEDYEDFRQPYLAFGVWF